MKKLLATLVASVFLLSGCGLKQNVVIKINNQDITKSQFDKAYEKAAKHSQLAQMGIDIPEDENNLMYLMVKDRVINDLIVRELLNQELKKRNITVTKKELEEEHQKMVDKLGSKEKFNEILKQNGIKYAEFEQDLKQEIMMKKLVDIIHPVNISEADAKKFYNNNLEKFKTPDQVRASHILIMANPAEIKEGLTKKNKTMTEAEINQQVMAEMAARYKKAQDIANEIKSTPDVFESKARELSDDKSTAEKGGDLGFFSQGEMVKEFADAAFKQRPNTISEVVQTPYGFHIIKVTDRKAAGQQPFDKIKDQLRMYLAAQEQVKALEQFLLMLKSQAVIEYVDDSYNPVKIEAKMKKIAEEKRKALTVK
ncbi:peptidylprolyl isomerase [bacterium]|nr:peptidylprolyl isomerase [bacterium]